MCNLQTADRCLSVCYPDFPLTSLYDNAIRKSSYHRFVWEKICWPWNNPATASSRRFQEASCRRAVLIRIVLPFCLLCSFFHISVFHSNLRQAGDLQTEGCRRQSVIPIFYLLHCMTALYTNIPITDSSGRKYTERGLPLPQLLPGAFKEVNRRRAVPACIVLPHSLLCSFFHISVFHSNLR